jgi:ribosomal protein S6
LWYTRKALDFALDKTIALCSFKRKSHLVHREVKRMNNYEVMFIIEAALEEDKKQAVIEMVKEIISAGGEVGKVNVWGNRKLAYPIQKKNEGYYVVIEFTANPELPKELDRRLKISDSIIRHIIINKDEK